MMPTRQGIPQPARQPVRHAIFGVIAAGLLAACTASTTPPPSRPAADQSPRFATAPPSAATSSAAPAAKPTPTPKPPAAAKWGEPERVFPGSCYSMQAGFDAGGRAHVAATCDEKLIYSVATPQGTWATRQFQVPANRVEQDPQLAFEGNVAWFAYSRFAIT